MIKKMFKNSSKGVKIICLLLTKGMGATIKLLEKQAKSMQKSNEASKNNG
jgi:hypothetical protein